MTRNCVLFFGFLWFLPVYAITGRENIQGKEYSCRLINLSPQDVNTSPVNDTLKYRLVVSFFSKASGIDKQARDDFEKLLSCQNPPVLFEKTRWGREGETDYCLTLADLSKRKQKKIVKKVKKMLKKTTLVHILEFSPCVHKR